MPELKPQPTSLVKLGVLDFSTEKMFDKLSNSSSATLHDPLCQSAVLERNSPSVPEAFFCIQTNSVGPQNSSTEGFLLSGLYVKVNSGTAQSAKLVGEAPHVDSPTKPTSSKSSLEEQREGSTSLWRHRQLQSQRSAMNRLLMVLRNSLQSSEEEIQRAGDTLLRSLGPALHHTTDFKNVPAPGNRPEQKRRYKRRKREVELRSAAQFETFCSFVLERAFEFASSGYFDKQVGSAVHLAVEASRLHEPCMRSCLDLIKRLRRTPKLSVYFSSSETLLSALCR